MELLLIFGTVHSNQMDIDYVDCRVKQWTIRLTHRWDRCSLPNYAFSQAFCQKDLIIPSAPGNQLHWYWESPSLAGNHLEMLIFHFFHVTYCQRDQGTFWILTPQELHQKKVATLDAFQNLRTKKAHDALMVRQAPEQRQLQACSLLCLAGDRKPTENQSFVITAK